MAIDRIGTTVITFTGNIVLARLLTPFDFGLLAMVAIFTGIAYNTSGCGLSDGLINKQHPTELDYSTVFVFNAFMGLVFCAAFIFGADYVADYFNHEELVGIMWAIGICFFINTLGFTQETRMRKELEIKKMCIVRISANLSAVTLGIILVIKGYSYWGLVSCRIFLSVFMTVFYIIASRWIPRIAFSMRSFKELFQYGINLMWAYVLNTISRYISTTALGKQSATSAGIYSQAQKMEEVPFGLTESIFNWPFFAVAANEPDPDRRKILVEEMFQWLVLLNCTAGLLLILLSSPGFKLLFGGEWDSAIPVFRILVVLGIAMSLKLFFQTVMKLHNRTNLIRNLTIIEVLFQLVALYIAFPYGLLPVAWSQTIVALVIMAIHAVFYCRLESTSKLRVLMTGLKLLPIPIVSFLITAIGYRFWNPVIFPVINCILCIMSYSFCFIALMEIFPNPIYLKYRNVVIDSFKKARL